MKTTAKLAVVSLLIPYTAFAHGEQVLALPIGQGMSFLAIFITAGLVRMSTFRRSLFLITPLLAIIGSWFVPSIPGVFHAMFDSSSLPWFLLGALPPVLTAAAVYGATGKRRITKDEKRA